MLQERGSINGIRGTVALYVGRYSIDKHAKYANGGVRMPLERTPKWVPFEDKTVASESVIYLSL